MKNCILIIVLISLAASIGQAQNLMPQSRRMPYLSDLFNGMPNVRPPSAVVGNIYLGDHWDPAHVYLYEEDKEIDGYFARYNLQTNELEFLTTLGTKALKGSRAKSFSTKDSVTGVAHHFVNGKDYSRDKTPLIGFLEVISNGPCSLMKLHYLIVKEPDYKPALNSGSRDTRISQKYELLYNRGNEVFKVPNKKKLLTAFGDKAAEMDTYIKTNSLYKSEEADLIKIFNYYNSIAQPK